MDLDSFVAALLAADEAIDQRQERVRRAFLNGTLDDFLAAEDDARSDADGNSNSNSDRSSQPGGSGDAIRIVDAVA